MSDDEYLRDFFAGLAMVGIVSRGIDKDIVSKVADNSYIMADAMMEARKVKDEAGIAGIGKRKYTRKSD